jgi:hypothetical protein
MNKILISNIGNRNITYKGKTHNDTTDGTFKEWTQQLLDNFELEKSNIKIQIIDQFLESKDFNKVILFSSNQINEEKQDQDTLFEAEIMKKLIDVQYGLETQIIEIQSRVIDNDALILFYRQAIRQIKKTNSDSKIIVCDAGGTPQQKSSLKIILEFFLDEDQFEVCYVNPSNGKIEPMPQTQYRRVIQAEQIRKLIEIGEYKSATKLLGFDDALKCSLSTNTAIKMLGLGHVLFERQWSNLMAFVNNSNHKQIQNSILLSRIKNQSSLIQNIEFKELFDLKELFKLGEMLAQIQFSWINGQYTSTIMQFAIFYENYLYEIIKHELKYDLVNDFDRENERLRKEAKIEFENVTKKFGESDITDGVPFKILVAENIKDEVNQSFLNLLKPFISDGKDFKVNGYTSNVLAINSIRNKIAHNGRIIQKQNIDQELPYFKDLLDKTFKLFNLPSENSYLKMNQFIVENL